MRVAVEEGVPLYCWHPLFVQEDLFGAAQELDRRLLSEHLDIRVSVSALEDGGR